MVKANGYGLGAVPVTQALEAIDPWGYGVATVDEGAELRAAGISRPIIVFTPLPADPAAVAALRAYELRPVIGDLAALDAWLAGEERGGPFHVEIDTGLSRSGFVWHDQAGLAALRTRLNEAPAWEGVFTHFHSADLEPASVTIQRERFDLVLASLPRRPRLVHFASSAALRWGPGWGGDLVRPGIFLYGGRAGGLVAEPVARLRTRVIALRRLRPGDPVSYGAEWTAERATTIATLAVGYADGVLRALGNRGMVEINEAVVPIAGRVTMDMVMVDAGDSPVAIGDVATLYGGTVTLDDQAARAGTVSYELLTAVSARVPRRYDRTGGREDGKAGGGP